MSRSNNRRHNSRNQSAYNTNNTNNADNEDDQDQVESQYSLDVDNDPWFALYETRKFERWAWDVEGGEDGEDDQEESQSQTDDSSASEDEDDDEEQTCIICYFPFNHLDHARVHTWCGHSNTCLACIFQTILQQPPLNTLTFLSNPHIYRRHRSIEIVLNMAVAELELVYRSPYFYRCPLRCHMWMTCWVTCTFRQGPAVVVEMWRPDFVLES